MKEINISKVNETIYYDTCDNGLDVYMWVNEHVNNYYATLNVNYGSIDTKFKVKNNVYEVPNGVAHFLEHINFNEPNGKTAHDYYNKMGSSINAFTTFEYTSYEVFGNTDIISNVNHLLDYVETPVITKELVEKEKGIIIEEVKMGDNNPGKQMYFGTNRIVFHKNKRINEVTGTVDNVKSITSADLKLVYNTFYHPKNMFLIITGNFNPYELMASIKENQCSKKFDKYDNPKVIQDKEDSTIVKDYQEIEGNVEIPKMNIVYKMPRKLFRGIDDSSLRVYLKIIMSANFGVTSDLKEELMEKELIIGLSPRANLIDDMVILSIGCETKYPNELVKIIKDNMLKLNISKERLERRKKCNIAEFITDFDDIECINSSIQDDLILYNKLITNHFDIYQDINLDEATKVLKHIDLSNSAVLVQLPKKNTNN
jgi:predicted Zn-dependent peptidase